MSSEITKDNNNKKNKACFSYYLPGLLPAFTLTKLCLRSLMLFTFSKWRIVFVMSPHDVT